jgi:hypothetical protein
MLQSSLSRFYLQKFSQLSLALIILAVGVYNFSNGDYVVSDRIDTLILCILSIHFRHNKNILSILLIIIAGRLFEEIAWLLNEAHCALKFIMYILAAAVFFKLRYDKLAKFTLSLLFCMVLAEFYWLATGYDNSPQISYYAAVLVEDIVIRHFILYRVYSFGTWSKQLSYTSIDWKLYNLMAVFVFALSLMIIEFFFRHILNIQTLVIYNSYPLIAYTTNYLILWLIVDHSLKSTRLFKA